ncbi:MAG: hypothetical protein ACYCQJ_05280 [Nitrososphaerales archaeon]
MRADDQDIVATIITARTQLEMILFTVDLWINGLTVSDALIHPLIDVFTTA